MKKFHKMELPISNSSETEKDELKEESLKDILNDQSKQKIEELYIFLGIHQGFYFFQHLIKTELNINMSGQIMNFLIHEERITDKDSVIIYEINPSSEIVDIVYIRHQNGEAKSFNKENLIEEYERLLTAEREDSFVISTDGEKFIGTEVSLSFRCENIDLEGFTINEIHEIVTIKPFLRSLGEKQMEYDKFQKLWNKIKTNPSHKRHEECSKYFISTFKVFKKDNLIITVSSLSEGVSTYLPKAEYISLFDNTGRVRMFTFDSFLEIMQLKSFNIKDKKDIIYYVCTTFPTEDQISMLVPFEF